MSPSAPQTFHAYWQLEDYLSYNDVRDNIGLYLYKKVHSVIPTTVVNRSIYAYLT